MLFQSKISRIEIQFHPKTMFLNQNAVPEQSQLKNLLESQIKKKKKSISNNVKTDARYANNFNANYKIIIKFLQLQHLPTE